jgi:uncharacterized protein
VGCSLGFLLLDYFAMKLYDVIIVGAGPAGLFAAYQLVFRKRKKPLKVLIIEKGNPIDKRKKSETLTGMGGAGTFSDGKLHFTPVLSHEKLLDLFSVKDYQKELDRVDELFTDFGAVGKYTPENIDEANCLVKKCQQKGVHLYLRKCKHVGSDNLPGVVSKIEKFLISKGVEIRCNLEVEEILVKNKLLSGVKCSDGKIYKAKKYLIAPGRVGASWLQKQAKKIGLSFAYQQVEIGVRVEFPAGIMEDHSKIVHENIYSIVTPTYDDVMRTFCPCPYGKVAVENYGEYVSVNGYSNANSKSPNSNFDFTTVVQLTEPVENTTDYAISMARMATIIGGGKPILQRLGDLKKGRRSTWKRIEKSYVKPTFLEVTPGDISMALTHRIVTNILEGFEILDRVLPGINSSSTLLYAPEIKLRGNRIKINNKLQTEIKNLYVAGDGAGNSGNITGAAVAGILAGKGMSK